MLPRRPAKRESRERSGISRHDVVNPAVELCRLDGCEEVIPVETAAGGDGGAMLREGGRFCGRPIATGRVIEVLPFENEVPRTPAIAGRGRSRRGMNSTKTANRNPDSG